MKDMKQRMNEKEELIEEYNEQITNLPIIKKENLRL